MLDLWEWPSVRSVFVHHGINLKLKGASCTNVQLYNTSASFTDNPSQAEWQSPESTSCSPRNVGLQYSKADKIPGKVKELEVLYSSLDRLENLDGLNWAYIVNSKVTTASIQNITEADIKIVDSEIEWLQGCHVGYGTSLNFVGSNVTLAEDNGAVVVLNGGSVTLQSTRLVSPHHQQSNQSVVVEQGGSFSVFASTERLTFFNPTQMEEREYRLGKLDNRIEADPGRGMAEKLISGVVDDYDGEEIPPSGSASTTLCSSTLVLVVCLALTGVFHKYKYSY